VLKPLRAALRILPRGWRCSASSLSPGLRWRSFGSYVENREGLEQLAALLQVASGLLTIEVALWITAIAGTV